jgi:SAM-dependent methyltransferase
LGPTDDELAQRQHMHWQRTYQANPSMYGMAPSSAAVHAADVFRQTSATTVLDLGAGHGRDSAFFAEQGFTTYALDVSSVGLGQLRQRALEAGVTDRVFAIELGHDDHHDHHDQTCSCGDGCSNACCADTAASAAASSNHSVLQIEGGAQRRELTVPRRPGARFLRRGVPPLVVTAWAATASKTSPLAAADAPYSRPLAARGLNTGSVRRDHQDAESWHIRALGVDTIQTRRGSGARACRPRH